MHFRSQSGNGVITFSVQEHSHVSASAQFSRTRHFNASKSWASRKPVKESQATIGEEHDLIEAQTAPEGRRECISSDLNRCWEFDSLESRVAGEPVNLEQIPVGRKHDPAQLGQSQKPLTL
jgi:hypothetical protein